MVNYWKIIALGYLGYVFGSKWGVYLVIIGWLLGSRWGVSQSIIVVSSVGLFIQYLNGDLSVNHWLIIGFCIGYLAL